jgi:GAF domain-containing protein
MLGPPQEPRLTAVILKKALADVMKLHGTKLGNAQLVDWQATELQITVSRGFQADFLEVFRRVRLRDTSVCARALSQRKPVVVEDVLADTAFVPYRAVARAAGFRAVLSMPMIADGNAFVGVLSVHFPDIHRPLPAVLEATQAITSAAANAILRARVARAAEWQAELRASIWGDQ